MEEHPQVRPDFDPSALRGLTGGASVATPAGLSGKDEDALLASGLAVPNYYTFQENDFSRSAEERTLAEMDRQQWLMLEGDHVAELRETPENMQLFLGLPFSYHTSQPVFTLGREINRDIRDHWRPVAQFGDLHLFRRR